MAKKKAGTSKKPTRRKSKPRGEWVFDGEAPMAPPIVRSVMEDFFGSAASRGTKAEQLADLLVEQAYSASPLQRIKLLEAAVAANPNCIDAYVMLGQSRDSKEDALRDLRHAVDVGERSLKKHWERYAGHFWGVVETRPYMRAKLELALCLWSARQYDESLRHMEELLALNPNDNQGVRYLLLSAYLEVDKNEPAAALMEQYSDDCGATWLYGRLILSFRLEGDSKQTLRLLNEAKKSNKFLPEYLLGDKMLPSTMPTSMILGGPDEAIETAASLLPAWRNTPGITSWLREALGSERRKRRQAKDASKVTQKKQRSDAPSIDAVLLQPGEVWQIDARQSAEWVQEGTDRFRPWVVVILSSTRQLIMASEICRALPAPEMICDLFNRAIVAPMMSEPMRPETVQLSRADWRVKLFEHCESQGVNVVVRDDLPEIDELFDTLTEQLDVEQESPIKPLIAISGITPEWLGGFFGSASKYYQRKPWQLVDGEMAIRVDAPTLTKKTWYASVMGQSGIEQGLALYDNLKELRRIFDGAGDFQSAQGMSALSLMFGESLQLSPRDLAAQEKHHWDVAGPEAYPCVLRVKKRMKLISPTMEEMKVMRVCLDAIPAFLRDTTKNEQAVTLEDKPVNVTLAIVELAL
jgi:tetratricopeptide (TPR) repeat protein